MSAVIADRAVIVVEDVAAVIGNGASRPLIQRLGELY
jgi:hypothetical protein